MNVIADGTTMRYGQLASGLKWQASGYDALAKIFIALLIKNCFAAASSLRADATTPGAHFMDESYQLDLTDDPGSELDPKFLDSPRQRIEFRSPINANGTLGSGSFS